MINKKRLKSEFSFFSGIGVSILLFAILVIAAIVYALNKETPNAKTPQAQTDTITNLPALPDSPIADVERIHIDSLRNSAGEGALTFIEYSDMTCEFCQRYHTTVQEVLTGYDGKIAYSYKHFPLEKTSRGTDAAIAAECASDQQKFFGFVHSAFGMKQLAGTGDIQMQLKAIAKQNTLDGELFTTCVSEGRYRDRINDDTLQALATGATGAPWSIVVDADGKIVTRLKGAIGKKRLQQTLDLALKNQKKQ